MKDFIIPDGVHGPKLSDMGTPEKSGPPVTLVIDGMDVSVPEGTSVMRAAADNDEFTPSVRQGVHARNRLLEQRAISSQRDELFRKRRPGRRPQTAS